MASVAEPGMEGMELLADPPAFEGHPRRMTKAAPHFPGPYNPQLSYRI